MTPSPGWYRDPKAPHLERWWDGTAWTEHRRTPDVPGPPVPAPPVPGPPQAYGPPDPGPQAPTPPGPPSAGDASALRSKVIALTAAGAVLVTAIVTGAIVLGEEDGGTEVNTAPTLATSQPAPREPATDTPTPTPSESTSEPSADDPAVVVDQLNGITLPLLDGWVRPQTYTEADVLMSTDGTYECPAEDFGSCRHGKVISRTATPQNGETAPEALAEADIKEAADEAYDRDRVGRRPFGGIESHQVVKSGPVKVAGRTGYFVRWRVRTAEGPGGYVQSLAFASPVGTEAPVIVRYVFDAGEDGPPLADMDRFTRGIRPTTD
ncbi:DUF2510 domain-containing protein [Streptomyces sp. DT2A-34]|uniref:DUF2510 domain-containing protein n=1 Tax=Streptomyces sp. DT2A-34 TaxID=3051182 RepID=UPI00265B9006|nr:DUF2510 domain-containing protein [Streptomyces sp. DT2A-34]MDO0916258.1 DUF2510 domain-containing protein [Streptomyces sp. DT2A-34]